MIDPIATALSAELGISTGQITNVLRLIADGATIPFIARYRKERTGSLDEVALREIENRFNALTALAARKEAVLASLREQGLLSAELERALRAAGTRAEVEDLYLPYRPKRRTRATAARELGLEPLAELLYAGTLKDVEAEASRYLGRSGGPATVEEALAGARDIIAERVSEDPETRGELRELFRRHGIIRSTLVKKREKEALTYRDYFRWSERASGAPSHRVLAVMRGSREKCLTVHLLPDEERAFALIRGRHLRARGPARNHVDAAAVDAYRRLMGPSLEKEVLSETVERASDEAIEVFAANVRELLMAPPLGGTPVLALDPGFRTGCKLVCLDAMGNLTHAETIYPLEPQRRSDEAGGRVRTLIPAHGVRAIAVGNGTGGRETMDFLAALELPDGVSVTMVNESGASVYSASEEARRELPDQDVTVRGAVSIGRRLMDPLAELVKIDPQSIGVGQYQHDVDQKKLAARLDVVVEACVHAVGVKLNTASRSLLRRVSGLSDSVAEAVVSHRAKRGGFTDRKDLLDVPGFGPKTFELAAGFLRVDGGRNPLDASAVHPERYRLVATIAGDLGTDVGSLVGCDDLESRIDPSRYVSEDVGLPTLYDILGELAKPGRDPRESFEPFSFRAEIREITDLEPGMKLPGIVTNVTAFGAFVDIGVHNDGLVHVSELADRYVADPQTVVTVGRHVEVTVLDVDEERRRISLSMRR